MINYEKLNKFQYEAVMHDKGPALLLAGAGTGKTRTLIYRVAHLIESGVSPESILLLTFTNKAANEMKERAEKMLKEKCGITACTYHSFCVKMLRFYGKMAGISPDFTIISGPDEADIIDIVKSELNFQKLKNMPSASVFASMLSTCVNKRLTLEELLKEQKVEVKVLKSHDKWFGVTYKEDKEAVVEAIRSIVANGVYPEKLFG